MVILFSPSGQHYSLQSFIQQLLIEPIYQEFFKILRINLETKLMKILTLIEVSKSKQINKIYNVLVGDKCYRDK